MQTYSSEHAATASMIVDVTADVSASLESSGVADGRVTVFAPDQHCKVVLNEYESGLVADIAQAIGRLDRVQSRKLFASSSVVVPAARGRLLLGTWQRVLLVNLDDRARDLRYVVETVGEPR